MREIPILFSAPMVLAILDGRKTMTRRVIKPQPNSRHRRIDFEQGYLKESSRLSGCWSVERKTKAPYQPGDRLWVRETWYKNYPHKYGKYFYRADGEEIDMPIIYGETVKYGKADGLKWKPSIHMPKDAARIWLEVTSVRVERLSEITEEDAIAEGIRIGIGGMPYFSCREAFAALWNSLNAKRGYSWDTNPWVWVIEFKKVTP